MRSKEEMEFELVENDLLTSKYTQVYQEQDFNFNAPHHFLVVSTEDNEETGEPELLAEIDFQEGPIKENGVNGVCNEDLLVMVLERLKAFQRSEYSCKENAMAITKIEETLLWLRKRTMGREQRNVEGTHKL
jgi:sugar diacid utilization regulator